MPPKKAGDLAGSAASAAPPPPPITAAMIAAQNAIDKWTTRADDAAKRVAENEEHIRSLESQRVTRERRLKELLAEVSVIALPKPTEPEPVAANAKAPKGGKKPVDAPPPPPPPDEEELKRLNKLQAAIIAIYKKKRERPVRDTPPATADSAASKHGKLTAAASAAASVTEGDADGEAGSEGAATPPAAPAVPEEPGIVKPHDLDPEIWVRVLKLRDERIENEEALLTIAANREVAEARRKNLASLANLTQYSVDAAHFEFVRAKDDSVKNPNAPSPPATPAGAGGSSIRRQSNRPPSQLLRR